MKLKRLIGQSRVGSSVSNWRAKGMALRLAEAEREESRRVELIRQELMHAFFSDKTVRGGPFQGIRYGRPESHGSVLLAKLAGTYEAELHTVFSRLASKNYSVVLDVGCAEGYYAVGAARIWPTAQIYAFDISETARLLATDLALTNDVSDRVHIQNEFHLADGSAMTSEFTSALMIVDIEGAERQLFINAEDQRWLQNVDLIIECHDFVDRGISRLLFDRFLSTHNVNLIFSVSDEFRPLIWCPDFAHSLEENRKRLLMAEGRPEQMCWIICESRPGQDESQPGI